MTAINRDPRGKFIDRGAALRAWVPTMMYQARQRFPFRELFDAACAYCQHAAAEDLREAARSLEGEDFVIYDYRIASVSRYIKIREILIECRNRIAAVKS